MNIDHLIHFDQSYKRCYRLPLDWDVACWDRNQSLNVACLISRSKCHFASRRKCG